MIRYFWKPIIALLAVLISFYGVIQFFILDPQKAGLVTLHLLEGIHYDPWIIFLKMHIAGGVMALALGPFQFSKRIQAKRRIHRFSGKVYIFSILLGGLAGFYVSSTALGGVISMEDSFV